MTSLFKEPRQLPIYLGNAKEGFPVRQRPDLPVSKRPAVKLSAVSTEPDAIADMNLSL